jgi:hypothetical protein
MEDIMDANKIEESEEEHMDGQSVVLDNSIMGNNDFVGFNNINISVE